MTTKQFAELIWKKIELKNSEKSIVKPYNTMQVKQEIF